MLWMKKLNERDNTIGGIHHPKNGETRHHIESFDNAVEEVSTVSFVNTLDYLIHKVLQNFYSFTYGSFKRIDQVS